MPVITQRDPAGDLVCVIFGAGPREVGALRIAAKVEPVSAGGVEGGGEAWVGGAGEFEPHIPCLVDVPGERRATNGEHRCAGFPKQGGDQIGNEPAGGIAIRNPAVQG